MKINVQFDECYLSQETLTEAQIDNYARLVKSAILEDYPGADVSVEECGCDQVSVMSHNSDVDVFDVEENVTRTSNYIFNHVDWWDV